MSVMSKSFLTGDSFLLSDMPSLEVAHKVSLIDLAHLSMIQRLSLHCHLFEVIFLCLLTTMAD